MAYTTNPHAPKVRGQAVKCVMGGMGVRTTARKFGVTPGCVSKWMAKAKVRGYGAIPTLSSRPKHHPNELPDEIVDKIVETKLRLKRCADVVWKTLENEGTKVCLSSVKRTLDRKYLTKKKSPWKRWHFSFPRPHAEKPGDLVEIDTIHIVTTEGRRIYLYTLIDVCSRFAYAIPAKKISASNSVRFVKLAQEAAPFRFKHIQSDNGPEFSKWFTQHIPFPHRHTRVRKSNDNAHIERFNRSIQEECTDKLKKDVAVIGKALPAYLKYYNEERLHFGLKLQAPMTFINSQVFPRY